MPIFSGIKIPEKCYISALSVHFLLKKKFFTLSFWESEGVRVAGKARFSAFTLFAEDIRND